MITWAKTVATANKTLNDFKTGDLVNYWLMDGTLYVGEVVAIENGTLITHFLQRRTEYGGKLWRFCTDDPEHEVSPNRVIRHVHHDTPLTKGTVRLGWEYMGYIVGVEDYCLKKDENDVPLDVAECDSESDDEGANEYVYDDFVVPDAEGEEFCHPKPTDLTSEQQSWVNETHAAVRDWNTWVPKDEREQSVKNFVDNMSSKFGHQEDERQFATGKSMDLHRPNNL